ncbi:HEPN domain-containing protein [Sphingomonas sp. S6]|jgi:hypothetical protein|uniref:HEPN domain-containing protein n=1 Tax=Sphingomonas sp. S6 TaxID=3368600 RepID=UPI0028E35FEA|nr:HEPN domain-containing protein [uncultured Sphingomonas sp.]
MVYSLNSFDTVEQEISRRFTELRTFWSNVKQGWMPPPATQNYAYTAGAGFTIVFIYSSLEFSINRSVRQLSQLISDYQVRKSDVCSAIMSLVHDPKTKALMSAGKKTRLQARYDLYVSTRSNTIATIHDELLAPELQNVWAKSIKDVFQSFGITDNITSDPSSQDYIDRIVNDRNAVAHGREAPDEIGARYTVAEMDALITRIEHEARHIVESFRVFYDARHFVSDSVRYRYLRRDARPSR